MTLTSASRLGLERFANGLLGTIPSIPSSGRNLQRATDRHPTTGRRISPHNVVAVARRDESTSSLPSPFASSRSARAHVAYARARAREHARARAMHDALSTLLPRACVRHHTHTACEEVGLRRHFRRTGIRTMNELVRVIAPTYDLSRGQIVSDNTHVGSRSQLQAREAGGVRFSPSRNDLPRLRRQLHSFRSGKRLATVRRLSRTRARTSARARARARARVRAW